jgi:mannose/fructose/N-acetylgalactosamine-specific phosphotransferase system component IIB
LKPVAVVLARVDNRLVHGQVLEAWAPAVGADTVVVIDEAIAEDPLRRAVIEGLSQPRLEVRLMDPAQAARFLRGEGAQRKVVLLFSDIRVAIEALDVGLSFERLNLGNIHPREASRPVTPSVYLTPEDLERLSQLRARGVEIEARAVPAERSPDLAPFFALDGVER